MEIKPTYWIRFFDDFLDFFQSQRIVHKSCQGLFSILATPSHKEGIKNFFTPPELQTSFDSFIVARVARVGPKPQFRKKTSECDWIACNHIFFVILKKLQAE
jgi:hypothetical protein